MQILKQRLNPNGLAALLIDTDCVVDDRDKSLSECDEYIRIFKYSNILVTNIYSDIRSYKFFFYEYIRTFVRVKFVCANIFGHSLVSVLECKT